MLRETLKDKVAEPGEHGDLARVRMTRSSEIRLARKEVAKHGFGVRQALGLNPCSLANELCDRISPVKWGWYQCSLRIIVSITLDGALGSQEVSMERKTLVGLSGESGKKSDWKGRGTSVCGGP